MSDPRCGIVPDYHLEAALEKVYVAKCEGESFFERLPIARGLAHGLKATNGISTQISCCALMRIVGNVVVAGHCAVVTCHSKGKDVRNGQNRFQLVFWLAA